MKMKIKLIIYGMLFGAMVSCDSFLGKKPELNMVVPESLQDLRALLDISQYMNISPEILNIVADDCYLEAQDWNSLGSLTHKNLYIWSDEVYKEANSDASWMNCYVQVNYANVVIHTLSSETKFHADDPEVDRLLGDALFYRSKAFFEIAQIWADSYDPRTASTRLGVPLRLSPDFNIASTRSTVEETYEQIVEDLREASRLLRHEPTEHVSRPDRCAAFALLARVYLTMGEFAHAAEMAERALALKNILLDYNDLDTSASLPFKRFNEEVIFNSYMLASSAINRSKVDSTLYRSYEETDLRKHLFFRNLPSGGYGFKGNYYQDNQAFFNGLTTAELYLVLAEAKLEMGDPEGSSEALNHLLQSRYMDGVSPEYHGFESEYKDIVLNERRKELVYRGLRWGDVRRYNVYGQGLSMERNIDGERYILEKGNLRFTIPIPETVISIAGIEQNP